LDLRAFLPADAGLDVERAATRAGRGGVLRAGLRCLDALATCFGAETVMPREELLGIVLPSALAEHDLLRTPASVAD
jgi:hypothetical protein